MSQEMSGPAGSLVASTSQISILQALRASFSAFSSGVRASALDAGAAGSTGAAASVPVSSAAEAAALTASDRSSRYQGQTKGHRGCLFTPASRRGVWLGAEILSSAVRQRYPSAATMALPISEVATVRQPSWAMSAVRSP